MGVLLFTALLTEEGDTKALCFWALGLFAVWPLITTGLLCIASGIVLGLGTKWGLVRYWWVAIKLALSMILVALVPLLLRPQVIEMAEQGRRFMTGEAASLAVGDLIYPQIVSPSALLVAFVLAVFKPWGRFRGRRAPARGPPGRVRVHLVYDADIDEQWPAAGKCGEFSTPGSNLRGMSLRPARRYHASQPGGSRTDVFFAYENAGSTDRASKRRMPVASSRQDGRRRMGGTNARRRRNPR